MSDILTRAQVRVPGVAHTKDEAIREAGQILMDAGSVGPTYIDSMFEREKSVSTFMGNYLAIPHGMLDAKEAILRPALSIARYDQGIDWDGNEVRFVVGIAGDGDSHLEILSRIALIFAETDEVDRLLAARSADEIYQLLHAVNED
jgi:mannitol PTS system EIIA component